MHLATGALTRTGPRGSWQRVFELARRRHASAFSLSTALVATVPITALEARYRVPDSPWLVAWLVVVSVAGLLMYVGCRSHRLKVAALALLVGGLLVAPGVYSISRQGPDPILHDGIHVTDAAADRLLQGLNPYGHDYVDSAALRRVPLFEAPVNWSLGHYPYTPGSILLDLPLRAFPSLHANMTWLWPVSLLVLCLAAYFVGRTPGEQRAMVIAVGLSPFLADIYFGQHNDVLMLALVLAAVALARRQRLGWAGLMVGLALTMKQTAVLVLPLAALLAYRYGSRRGLLRMVAAAAIAFAVITLPFLLWDPAAFVRDTATFFFGSGTENDPVRGWGFSGLLLAVGGVPSRWSHVASGWLEAVAVLPILAVSIWWLRRRWSWPLFWGSLAAQFLAVFFFGRLLLTNYLDLVLVFATIGLLLALPAARNDVTPPADRRPWIPGARFLMAATVLTVAVWGTAVSTLMTDPPRAGIRVAMSATSNSLYLARASDGAILSLQADGHPTLKATLAGVEPVAMAMTGQVGLVGTERDGLWVTDDGANHWRRVTNLPQEGRTPFFTVAASGTMLMAGQWGEALFVSQDSGASWERAAVPNGDTEFEALLPGATAELAATELGLLRSTDGGRTWSRVAGVPDRLTALSRTYDEVLAGDWRGNTYRSVDDGRSWAPAGAVPGGVWHYSAADNMVATTHGLIAAGVPVAGYLGQAEIVQLQAAGDAVYAVPKGGPLYRSVDGGRTWIETLDPR